MKISLEKFLKLNFIVLIISAIISFGQFNTTSQEGLFFIGLKTLTGIVLIIFSGLSSTLIIQYFLKKKFNATEFLCLSVISVFFIPPVILTLEYIFLKKIYSFLPLINIVAIFVLLLAVKIFAGNKDFATLPEIVFSGFKKITKHPLFACGVIYIAVIIATTFTYRHLPDGDPYTWISRLETLYNKSSLLSIAGRPLFSALFYCFKELTGASLFATFKYLVPLFLILPLAPAWLAASQLKNKLQQYLILLIPLAVPNTILYSQMAMPQAVMIVFTFYFAFFLIYAYLSKKEVFYYIAGLLSFLTVFYHEAAIITFIIWLAITLIYNFRMILKNKLIFFLTILVLISNYDVLYRYVLFVTKWIDKIVGLFTNNPVFNYLYPYQYINVDGNNMGWQSIGGVIKFYSFYAGPLIIFLIIFTIVYIYKKDISFRNIIRLYFDHKELAVILLSFAAFFSISEILPRFPGIAMLPDRAWIFAGIFFICSILPFINFKYFANLYKPIFYLFILLIIVSIYGAFFINYQKKYLISQADIRAADWIDDNLPADRILYSTGKKAVLNYYAKSKSIDIPSEFYFSENYKDFVNMSESCVQENNFSIETTSNYLKNLTDEAEKTRLKLKQAQDISSEINISLDFAKQNQGKTTRFIEDVKNTTDASKLFCNDKYYIFYSEMNQKNPYYSRPYELSRWGIKNSDNKKIIFDKLPEDFRKIYNDPENKIYIWEIL